jgi:starch phosphorylase
LTRKFSIKRIHEYKRQTRNVFSITHRYLTILECTEADRIKLTPRACIIGGKSAPGYYAAKKLIKLVNNVGRVVNSDPTVGVLLKVVFVPNYNVSLAELIVPGSDINQQISTAGTEASGTSCMKFAFNGSLIVGTWDGANIEIGEAIGEENVFFFGAKTHQVEELKATAKSRPLNPSLVRVFRAIRSGLFGDPHEYECLLQPIENADGYLLNADFQSYLEAQAKVDAAYRDQKKWVRMSITSTANMAQFSSDRTIKEYARQVWNIKPHPVPYTEAGGVRMAPVPRPESIGSLRRQQQAALTPDVAAGTAAPLKGSFGSLTRRSASVPLPPKPVAAPVKDDSDEESVPIDELA